MDSRITIDPHICHGKPVIRNTRVLVATILADLAAGETPESIIANFPTISREDIRAAIAFGNELAGFGSVAPP